MEIISTPLLPSFHPFHTQNHASVWLILTAMWSFSLTLALPPFPLPLTTTNHRSSFPPFLYLILPPSLPPSLPPFLPPSLPPLFPPHRLFQGGESDEPKEELTTRRHRDCRRLYFCQSLCCTLDIISQTCYSASWKVTITEA